MEKQYLKFRWYVIATNIVATAASGMILILPTPLVGNISSYMGEDLGIITGITMLPFTLCVAIGSLCGGFLIDTLGIKKTYLGSIAITILGLSLMPFFKESLLGIGVLRALQGFGSGPVVASISRIAAEWFPTKERALVTGLQSAGLSLGIALGFFLSPRIYLITNDWILTLLVVGLGQVVALVMTIILALFSKSNSNEKFSNSQKSLMNIQGDFIMALKQPAFWIIFLIVFMMSWITQAFNDLTPGYIAIPSPVGNGFGPQIAGTFMSLYQVVGIFGAVVSGFVLEKIFKGRIKVLLAIVFFIGGAFTSSILFSVIRTNSSNLLICLLIGGFFLRFVNPLCMAFISKKYPENLTGKIGGMTMGMGIFGGTIGVSVGSFVLHESGSYFLPIIIVCVICFIGFLLSLLIRAPKTLSEI